MVATLQGEARPPQPPRRALTHWGPRQRARLTVQDSCLGVGADGRSCPPLKIGTSILEVLSEGIKPAWGVQGVLGDGGFPEEADLKLDLTGLQQRK